ncbi:MAG: HAMP domain-containing histidine kinase [Oscillospiraceae bacterium]|nr:HAMP domain-containing histidine kinase [Oscillospiraceae bacterium]
MRIFANAALRLELAVGCALMTVCAGVCFFLRPAAAIPIAVCGLLLFVLRLVFAHIHYNRLNRLTAQIEELLRHTERISFPGYEEGELSVLANAVRKLAGTMLEQHEALSRDHIYLRESLENISHQLRTPLTSMTLVLRLLSKSDLTDAQRRAYLQELKGLLSRMQYQIEMLLKLSAIEAGAAVFASEPVDCAGLIRSATDAVAVSAELKGVTIVHEIREAPRFLGDFHHSAEALTNLLKNSIEHTPEGGHITVAAGQDALSVTITVTDDGEGIPEEDLPHLFERFYRGTHSSKTGFGIGLAYARQVIEKQNGLLEAVNLKPHGAQFCIRIYAMTV